MAGISGNTTYDTESAPAATPTYPTLNINPAGAVKRYSPLADQVRTAAAAAKNTAPFGIEKPLLGPQTTDTIQPTPGVDTGNKYLAVPSDYGGFKQAPTLPYERVGGLTAPVSPAIRQMPWAGGGEYNIDTSNPGSLIKQPDANGAVTRKYNQPDVAKQILGPLPSSIFQIDHIIPLWAGGADTPQNLQVLPLDVHETKTKVQAVPLTLLSAGKITADQARVMAMNWQNMDASIVPTEQSNGLMPVDQAEKIQKQWNDEMMNGKPVSFSDVLKGIPEAAKDFGKGWLPDIIREGIKGFTSGVTAGIVPYTSGDNENTADKLVGVGGEIAGTIFGLGKFKLALEPLLAMTGWKVFANTGAKVALADLAPTLVKGAAEDVGIKLAADTAAGATEAATKGGSATAAKTLVGSLKALPAKVLSNTKENLGAYMNYLRKNAAGQIIRNASVFVPYGAASEIGQHFVGKQNTDLMQEMTKRFTSDLGLSALTGIASPTLKGAAGVGLGVLMMDTALGSSPKDAMLNALTMGGLHGLGTLRPEMLSPEKLQGAVENEATSVGQNILHWWAPDVVPEVPKGQPGQFAGAGNFDENTRMSSQQTAQQWTTAALAKLDSMHDVISPDEYQMYKNQITTAGHYLNQTTLPPEERQMAAVADLASVAQKAKATTFLSSGISLPETVPDFMKSVGEDNLFRSIPRETDVQDTPTTGEIRMTGTGIDGGVNEQNMVKFAQAAKTGNASSNLLVVNRPDTAPLWSHISSTYTPEDIEALKRKPFSNPQNAAQVIGVVRDASGKTQLLPLGWIPRRFTIDEKAGNFNDQPEIKSGQFARNNPERNKDSISQRMTDEDLPVVTMRLTKTDVSKLVNGKKLKPDQAGAYLIGQMTDGDWSFAKDHWDNVHQSTPTQIAHDPVQTAVSSGINLGQAGQVTEALQGTGTGDVSGMKAQDVLQNPLLAGTAKAGQPEVATYLGTVDDVVKTSGSPEQTQLNLEKIGLSSNTAARIAQGEPVTAREIVTSVDRKNLIGEDVVQQAEKLLGPDKVTWFQSNSPEARWGDLPVTSAPTPQETPVEAPQPEVAPAETAPAPDADALSEALVARATKGDIPVNTPGKPQKDFITTNQGQKLGTTKNEDGTSWLEQNPEKNSEWGGLAKKGHTVEHLMRAGGRMGYAGKIRVDGQEMTYEQAREKAAKGEFDKQETPAAPAPETTPTPETKPQTPEGGPDYKAAKEKLQLVGFDSAHNFDAQSLDSYTDSLIREIQNSGTTPETQKKLAQDAMRLLSDKEELNARGVSMGKSSETWEKQIHGMGYDTVGKYLDAMRGRIADTFDTEPTGPTPRAKTSITKDDRVAAVKSDVEPFLKGINDAKSEAPTTYKRGFSEAFDKAAKSVWGPNYQSDFGFMQLLSDKTKFGESLYKKGVVDPKTGQMIPALNSTETDIGRQISQPKDLVAAVGRGDRTKIADIVKRRNSEVAGSRDQKEASQAEERPGANSQNEVTKDAIESGLRPVDEAQTPNENIQDLSYFEAHNLMGMLDEIEHGEDAKLSPIRGVEDATSQIYHMIKNYNIGVKAGAIKGTPVRLTDNKVFENVKAEVAKAAEKSKTVSGHVDRAKAEIEDLKKQAVDVNDIGGSPRAIQAIREGEARRVKRIKQLEDFIQKHAGTGANDGQGGPGFSALSPINNFPTFSQTLKATSSPVSATTPVTNTQGDITPLGEQKLPGAVQGQSVGNYLMGESSFTNPNAPKTQPSAMVKPDVSGATTALTSSENSVDQAHKGFLASIANAAKNGYDTVSNTAQGVSDAITGTTRFTNPNAGQIKNPSAVIGGYDTSSYAEDPLHAQKIRRIIGTMPPQFSGSADVGNYIRSVAPNSPVTGAMVVSAAQKFGVPVSLILATIQQDSSFGTAGLGAKTRNPGNVGTYGNKQRAYPDWGTGVEAVARWLSEHNTNGAPDQVAALPFAERVTQ